MDSVVTHKGKCDAEKGGNIGFAKDDFKKLSKDYLVRNKQKCVELLSYLYFCMLEHAGQLMKKRLEMRA